jgi:hypothetical protein
MWRSKLLENQKIKGVINTELKKNLSPKNLPSNYNNFFSHSYDSTGLLQRKDVEKDEKETINSSRYNKVDKGLNSLKLFQHNNGSNNRIGMWRNKTTKTLTTPRLWYIMDL